MLPPESKHWMKWSDSLMSLLGDTTGSELFEKYLQQEGVSSQLDFIYAVDGLKSTANEDEAITLSQKIRSILCLSQILIGLSASTRDSLNTFYTESTKHLNVDVTIFDKAIEEVESHMRTNLYPNFLKSDIYINCIANYTSTNASSATLQTVQEDIELVVKRQGLTRKALKKRNWWRDEHQLRNESSLGSSGTANPYHAGYSPFLTVSRQDSEIQSLSSGANTEHRFPIESRASHSSRDTPSSRGREASTSSRHKQPQQIDNLGVVQSGYPGAKNMPHLNKGEDAETRPDTFASILIGKLRDVANREAHGFDRFSKRINDLTPHLEPLVIPSEAPGPAPRQQQPQPHVIFEALKRIKEQPSEHADDILEEHFSRVFPDKTPDGRPSPPHQLSKSPPLFGKPKQSHGMRKQGRHTKKTEDLETGAFACHQSRTPGYEEVLGTGGPAGGIPSARINRRQQRSDIIDSGISLVSSSIAALSQVSSSAPSSSAIPWPGDQSWRVGRGGNGNGSGSSCSKIIQAFIFYEDDPKGVPYGLKLPFSKLTLGIFKEHLPRRGPFRYFFKRHSSSVEGSIVQEEITRDDQGCDCCYNLT